MDSLQRVEDSKRRQRHHGQETVAEDTGHAAQRHRHRAHEAQQDEHPSAGQSTGTVHVAKVDLSSLDTSRKTNTAAHGGTEMNGVNVEWRTGGELEGEGVRGPRRSYHHEGHTQCNTEDDWPRQVRLVHDAAIRRLKGVQHCQGLLPDVVQIDAKFWTPCRDREARNKNPQTLTQSPQLYAILESELLLPVHSLTSKAVSQSDEMLMWTNEVLLINDLTVRTTYNPEPQ